MIFTIIGKPGGGKSYYALRHIINVLVNTDNSVVTGLSVIPSELHAYINKRYPDKDIDVTKRLRVIDEKQSRRFWLYRLDKDGRDVDLTPVTRDEEKAGINVDYSLITDTNRSDVEAQRPRTYPGIDYVIDECHVFFDARSWSETGLSLTYYNSQHRKFNDNALFITQFLELIDKRVKSFSQEFIYLRNNGAEKIFTLFRGPSYFTARHYQRPPSGLSDFPSETHRFTLDPEIASCYDTSAGVGISGIGKPETKVKKGISLWWLVVPLVLFMAFLTVGPEWLLKKMMSTGPGKTLTTADAPPKPAPSFVSSLIDLGGGSGPAGSAERGGPGPDLPPAYAVPSSLPSPPIPTGYILRGNRVQVSMSDGSARAEFDGLIDITRTSVTLDGVKTYLVAPPRPRSSRSHPVAPLFSDAAPESTVSPVPVVETSPPASLPVAVPASVRAFVMPSGVMTPPPPTRRVPKVSVRDIAKPTTPPSERSE